MMTTMTIEELRRLEAEATPGPWDVSGLTVYDTCMDSVASTHSAVDAALIVAMRNALPELLKALEEARTPRPKDEWHEDYGDVVWWARFEGEWIGEAAWIGTPNDSDWSGHHTHWTPHPAFPLPPHGGVDV